jgi:hypothetical protein
MGKTLTFFIGGLPQDFRDKWPADAAELAGAWRGNAKRAARRPPDPLFGQKKSPAGAGP